MKSIRYRLAQLRAIGVIFRHYRNPVVMLLLRLGLCRMRFFPFELKVQGEPLVMLGRPATSSMADQYTLREVFIDEVYACVLPLLPPGPVRVVDAGANIGAFTVWLARRQGIREIFCFEPEAMSLRLLRANLGLNACAAQVLPVGLGGHSRTVQLQPNRDHPAATNIYPDASARGGLPAQEIQVVAFRDWLAGTSGEFDLLKLDCECAEWEIVESLTTAELQRFRAAVIEVHPDLRDLDRPIAGFAALMEARGFETVRWDGVAHGLYVGRRRA